MKDDISRHFLLFKQNSSFPFFFCPTNHSTGPHRGFFGAYVAVCLPLRLNSASPSRGEKSSTQRQRGSMIWNSEQPSFSWQAFTTGPLKTPQTLLSAYNQPRSINSPIYYFFSSYYLTIPLVVFRLSCAGGNVIRSPAIASLLYRLWVQLMEHYGFSFHRA